MNEKNIDKLKQQLISLGLPQEIEFDLRANICLQQDRFTVNYRQVKEQDIMNSIFYYEKKESEYCCSYYEALLRKKSFVPNIVVNETDVKELEERMAKNDWQILLSNNGKGEQQFEAIENIIIDLKKLSATTDGLQLAERLKINFWMDTPFVFLIPNIGALRNQYELSQRFYFFQDEEQISLDEAYRFLCHRWREKQLNAKKKQTENSDEPETASGGAATKDKRILTKKKNNKSKPNQKH